MELVVVALAVRLICPAIKHNTSAEHRETHVRTRCVNLLGCTESNTIWFLSTFVEENM